MPVPRGSGTWIFTRTIAVPEERQMHFNPESDYRMASDLEIIETPQPTRFELELAKVWPEGHSAFSTDDQKIWCPWAYKRVGTSIVDYGDSKGHVCNGCLRPTGIIR